MFAAVTLGDEDGLDGKARGDELADHEFTLGHEEAVGRLVGGEAGDRGELAVLYVGVIREARVEGVRDANDLRPRLLHGRS